MNIKRAESAGFCFGVSRAVNIVNDLLNDGEKVCTLGPIIHNKDVVEELNSRGCVVVENISEVPQGATLVIRSHGVARSVIDELEKSKISYKDATSPFVRKINKI